MDVDILIPGHYYCDLIFSELPRFPSLGTEIFTGGLAVVPGGVVNTVVAMHRLGLRVGWVGALGNNLFSNLIHDFLKDEGLDLSLIDLLPHAMQRVTVALSYLRIAPSSPM
jgi:sugar/nucleoside kinase (ribokinase family)